MNVDQARRFKELEKENTRLKRAVANLTVGNRFGRNKARSPQGLWKGDSLL